MPIVRRAPRKVITSQLTAEITGSPVPVTVVRSSRRRRTIAVAVVAGTIRMQVPMASTDGQLADLLARKATWIAGRLRSARAVSQPTPLVDGATVPYRGQELTLRIEARPIRRSLMVHCGNELRVQIPASTPKQEWPEAVSQALLSWYRERAAEVLPAVASHWATLSVLVPERVLIRDQRRRRGSCGPDGTIRLNWRLILLEPALADYVVVHEIAHLRHRHHQATFWDEVARLIPNHRDCRRRLNAEGKALSGPFDGSS